MLATFLVGVAVSLSRADVVGTNTVLVAILSGLLAVVVLQFTVGTVWAYAVEYANAGGSWTDAPFLTPFVVAALVAAAAFVVAPTDGGAFAALWAGFWGFVVTTAMVALVVRFYAGYAKGRS